jgi:L-asparaginase II
MTYLVLYAKVANDEKYGLTLVGIYLAGTKETRREATELASKCSGRHPGFIIIPRICTFQDNMRQAITLVEKNFEQLIETMCAEEHIV